MAAFIAGLRYRDLPADVIADARYRILDWLGSAMAGVHYKASVMVTDMAREMGGEPQSTILKGSLKVSAPMAAFTNGIIGHVAEFDDGHRLAIAHPGAVTVPVALAVAESFNRSGKELLTAVIAGYEVLIRLAIAVNPSHYKIWHTTSTCGAFAAAASASSLLKLDRWKTLMALGTVGTMSCGYLAKTVGTYAKPLNAGHACQSGVQAALLAMRGFTGPKDILTGEKGFIQATSADCNTKLLKAINKGKFISNTSFYKVYASCGHTNSPLDAIFGIMKEQDIVVRSIKRVQVATYRTSVEMTGAFRNRDEEEAKFSLPYCIAAALLYKKITLDEFKPDRLKSAELKKIADKIKVVEDPEATKVFPARRATVRIEFDNGRVIEKIIKASSDTPDYSAIEEKFLSLAETCVDHRTALKIKILTLDIDKLSNLNKLVGLLR
jgi:2-methylcitrate dehydratase PrpD